MSSSADVEFSSGGAFEMVNTMKLSKGRGVRAPSFDSVKSRDASLVGVRSPLHDNHEGNEDGDARPPPWPAPARQVKDSQIPPPSLPSSYSRPPSPSPK